MSNIGVYKIININNNKFYIGSSICLNRRKENHIYQLNKNIHNNKHLQSSYNKYGKEAFKFEILENCKECEVLEREQYYIDTLRPHYNLCKIAGNTLGIRHSEETKDKISKANKGKIRTKETLLKLSKKWNGKYNNSKKVYLLDSNYCLIKEWDSCGDASREYGLNRLCFSKLARKGSLITSNKSKLKGYIVTYNLINNTKE